MQRWMPAVALTAAGLLFAGSASGKTGAGRAPGEPAPRDPALEALPDDLRMGLEVALMLSETIGLHEDDGWQVRLAEIGYRVAAVAGDEDLLYNFQILDLPEPNAMALPGGFLFVTRGMLESGITDDELAHLIGHEIGHVHREHFSRSSRLETLFSLLQTALMVGVLLGGPEGGAQRVSVAEDPGDRTWAVGMSGKAALLQGTSIVGSVTRALFERGYSRKLEYEADETGYRLAVQAGYAPEGGVGLLQRLRDRSFEGNRFSYWRTHPFFEDRLARATARGARAPLAASHPDDDAYRQRVAITFATLAEDLRGEPLALYAYRCALQAEPRGLTSLPAALKMVRFKKQREERRHPLERSYGPLVVAYDSLIQHAVVEEPSWAELGQAREERRTLDLTRRGLLPGYLARIDSSEASTELLERFVENYPDHERLAEATYLLGLHYQLSGRVDEALRALEDLLAPPLAAAAAWADSAEAVMLAALGEVEDLELCQEVHDRARESGRTKLQDRCAERLEELVAEDLTLKAGGRYLQVYPDSPWAEQIEVKVWDKAGQMHREARVNEGLHRYQEALNTYFAILALAPGSPAADDADAAIERIHRMETFQ